MRKGFLCSLFSLFIFAGISSAQYPGYYPPTNPGYGAPYPTPQWGMGPQKVYVGGALSKNGSIALPSVRKVSYQVTPQPKVRQTTSPRIQAVAKQPTAQPQIRQAQANTDVTSGPTPDTQITEPPVEEHVTDESDDPPQVIVTEVVEAPFQEECVPAGQAYYPKYHIPNHSGKIPMRAPRGYRWYGDAEFLFWWIEGQNAPPLLTTNTTTLVGGELGFDNRERTGGRFTVGHWLDSWNCVGLEVTTLFLGQRHPSFVATGAGGNLAVPFINGNTGAPAAFPLGLAGASSRYDLFSRIYGAEAHVRYELCRGCWGHIDALGGFRYWHMDEGLNITTQANLGGGTTATLLDAFGTDNSFYGGQLGLDSEFHLTKRIFLGLTGKVALGSTWQTVDVAGSSSTVTGAGGTNFNGGIFAQPTNSGTFRQNQFTVVPEVNIRLGARVTDNLRIAGGYSFLWISNVARVGEQVNPVVNPAQILGNAGTGAGPVIRDSGFWMHGLSAELEYRF